MKYFARVYFLAILFFYLNSFSQDKTTVHKVEKNETILQIAQKYHVTPHDIYLLNPDAQRGLNPNMVLLIPKQASMAKVSNNQPLTHKVETKETLFGIEKKYNVSYEALKKANPFLEKDGLQIGQILTIPSNSKAKAIVPTQDKNIYHVVLAKETKYSIAKKYGITVEELEKRNPEIIPNLTVGYNLLIKGSAPKVVKNTEKEAIKDLVKAITINKPAPQKYVEYEVKPKETLFSLSKQFGLSQEELIALNPILSKGVEIGMVLKVPASTKLTGIITSTSTVPILLEPKKAIDNLTNRLELGKRKKLVMLIPFNIPAIEGDTLNSASNRLRKDKFLNITLDFYAGALMAIDSIKGLGIPIDVKILDSQESKNASNVASIYKENNLDSADAIIGPFYQSNAEVTANLVAQSNVPVISPLSKEVGNYTPNLFQSIPSTEVIKSAMFDYMRSKKGNVIDVIDKKKESSRNYIEQFQKDVKIANSNPNGSLNTASLRSMFVKGKTNYVILETGNTVMIKATIKTMVDAMRDYNVQLVVLETNETLDTDEILFENLIKLKLMYPSINRENESPEAMAFKNEFKKKNKIYPNVYAMRGFDVTFDTMMRLSQDKSYQETLDSLATEQIDNRFEYYRKEDGGLCNKGVYILYYDSDLTVKEAN